MAKKKTESTSKPTVKFKGRNKEKYTFGWNIPNSGYGGGLQFRYRTKAAPSDRSNASWGQWCPANSIGTSKTEHTITLDPKVHYPYKPNASVVLAIQFQVRGKRKETSKVIYEWSDWGSFTHEIPKPPAPKLSYNRDSLHQTTFSWDAQYKETSGVQMIDCRFESYLMINWNKSKSDASDFASGTGNRRDFVQSPATNNIKYYNAQGKLVTRTNFIHSGLTGSKPIPEESEVLYDGNSHTRVFRAITRGISGYSAWSYIAFPYGAETPTVTIIDDDTVVDKKPDGSVVIYVKWDNNVTEKWGNPISSLTVQYVVTTAGRYLEVPSSVSGWVNVTDPFPDKGSIDAIRFTIPAESVPGKDQAMYIRVYSTSALDSKPSIPIRVDQLPVVLKSPTLTSVTTDDQTKRATVTATNNSEVPGSFLKVYGKATNAQDDHELGVIEEGETSVTVDWSILDGQGAKTFGVRAFVYDESGQEQLASSEKIIYQGGTVPEAPTNVDASQDSANPDTILISWDWTWTEANGVELSWSEDKMAWESTNGPSTYEISNLKPNHWRISGLNMGTKWWVRVRLIKTVGDNAVYGSYSEPVSVELYTTPSTPYLHLSDTVVPQDGTVTATWAYTSQDGSAQSNAIICEVTRSNGVISYGQEVGRVADSTQRIIIEPAKVSGWCTGSTAETHELALNVQSETGKTANWSEPVSLTIAKKPTASIASPPTTSLVYDTIKMGEITRSGDEVVFNYGDVPPTIENVEMDIVPQISGSGTPSPTNVRTITGYNSVTLTDTDIYENEETYSVAMPNADKPVYAGHLNMTTGALRIDKTVLEFDGTENWSKVGDYLLLDISDETFSVNEDLFGDRYVYDPNHYAANAFSVENSSTNNYVGYGVVGTMTVV